MDAHREGGADIDAAVRRAAQAAEGHEQPEERLDPAPDGDLPPEAEGPQQRGLEMIAERAGPGGLARELPGDRKTPATGAGAGAAAGGATGATGAAATGRASREAGGTSSRTGDPEGARQACAAPARMAPARIHALTQDSRRPPPPAGCN